MDDGSEKRTATRVGRLRTVLHLVGRDGPLSRVAARHPRGAVVVGALVAALGVLTGLVAWSVSSPYGTTPDDDFHLISIYCPDPGSAGCPVVGRTDSGRPEIEVPRDVFDRMCYWASADVSGDCVKMVGPDGPRVKTDRVNLGEYPGLYYRVMHVFASDDINRMELSIRLANSLLAAVLLFVLAVLTEPVGRRVLIWTVAVTAVPSVPYLVASITPDAWSFMGVITALVASVSLFRAQERWRRASLGALAVLGVGMSAAARSDAAAVATLIVVAVSLIHWRELGDVRLVGRRLVGRWGTAAAVLAAVVVGGAGFLSGSQSRLVVSGFGGQPQTEVDGLHLLVYNAQYLPDWLSWLWWRGLLGIDVPFYSGFLLFTATAVVVWCGISRGGMTWTKAAGLALAVGALVGAPLALLQGGHGQLWTASHGLQTRYMVPFLIAVVGVAVVPVAGRTGRYLSLRGTVVLWFVLVVVQSVNLHIWIRRWVTGLDVKGVSFDAYEWWRDIPLSPNAVWVLGSLGFAVAAAAVLATRWDPPVSGSAVAAEPGEDGRQPEPAQEVGGRDHHPSR